MIGKKLTTEEFIVKAINIHGNKYDYSKVVYINSSTKVEIICPIHKEFWQIPENHLAKHGGRGCLLCGRDKTNSILRKRIISNEEFVKKANIIHHNKYDYSKVKYLGASIKIEIICPIHKKSFLQIPSKHLNGQGCNICANISCGQKLLKNIDDFVNKANIVHNYKYNYLESIYTGNKSKLIIKCPIHNYKFEQSANAHLQGQGCPKCGRAASNMEEEWLNSLNIPICNRSKTFKINNKLIKTDAFDITTNTVYEFYGDYWHGNPKIYDNDMINKSNKKTFGELYQKTIEREELIKEAGYNLVTIWEDDWSK